MLSSVPQTAPGRIQAAAQQKTVTRRGGLCGSSGGAHVPGSPINHSGKLFNNQREDSKLRRGSMSRTEFIASAVLLSGTKSSRRALARANCFDVIGGVSQSEIDVSTPTNQTFPRV